MRKIGGAIVGADSIASMSRSKSKSGKVYLVGAGPGDLGLVTLRAKECIERADAIVYDHLANAEMLGWARDDAEIVYAGKRAGEHALSQEEINNLLVEKARAGKEVVRLKGGDPFVFGRGAEEAKAIVDAGSRLKLFPNYLSDCRPGLCRNSGDKSRGELARDFFTGHEDHRNKKCD